MKKYTNESSIERYKIGEEYSSLLDVAEASGVSLNVILQSNIDIIDNPEKLETGLIIEIPKDVDKIETLETEYEESLKDLAKNFKTMGVIQNYKGHKITWYSENVLPGEGLDIPGRHTDKNGIVRDEDGYVCVASGDYEKGTIVSTNLGYGKVYDCGCHSGTIDIYTNW